jgi:hypothetical protein
MSAASASSPNKRTFDNLENPSPAKRNRNENQENRPVPKAPYSEEQIAARKNRFKVSVESLEGRELYMLVLKNYARANSELRRALVATAVGMKTEGECKKLLRIKDSYKVSMNGGKSFIEAKLFCTGDCQDTLKRARHYFVFMGMDSQIYIIDHNHFDASLAVITPL